MKWLAMTLFAALAAATVPSYAQRVLPIGKIAQVDDTSATTWGMSGFEIVHIRRSDNGFTPIMRTEQFDARTVEILSRAQAPRLQARDVQTLSRNGHQYITVRNYLLMEVRPQDAAAEGTSISNLANRWASRIRTVLPQVAPMPTRTGV